MAMDRGVESTEHGIDDTIAARRVKLEGVGSDGANLRRDGAPNHRAGAVQSRLDRFIAQTETRFPVSAVLRPSTSRSMNATRYVSGSAIDGVLQHAMQLAGVSLPLGVWLRSRQCIHRLSARCQILGRGVRRHRLTHCDGVVQTPR